MDGCGQDPKGNIVKRWVSRTPQIGVVSVAFTMPDLPSHGWWKIRVWARGQEEEKKFYVHKIYEPLFEVFIDMPFYGLPDDEAIEGTITGSFTNDKPVYGNATITLYVKQPWTLPDSEFKRVDSQYFPYVDMEEDFSFPMESLAPYVDRVEKAEVKVDLEFYDFYTWMKGEGHSRMRILPNQVEVEVVGTGPFVFRPGMPFSGTVAVKHNDGEPLEKDRLASSTLIITPSITGSASSSAPVPRIIVPSLSDKTSMKESALYTLREAQTSGFYGGFYVPRTTREPEGDREDEEYEGHEAFEWFNEIIVAERELKDLMEDYAQNQYFAEYRETGIFRFKFDVPDGATSLRLDVSYSDEDSVASASAVAHTHYHPEKRFIQVTSSTDEANVGEFVILHVRTNFRLSEFVYMVLSKGMILHSSTEVTEGDNVVTMSLAVSSSMAPRFTIVVYATTGDGEVLADALTVPVQVFGKMDIKLEANQHKDHIKKTVEFVTGAPAGSFYALICQRGLNYVRQHPNALTHTRIIDQLSHMEPTQRTVHGVLHHTRDGEAGDRLVSLPASSYARDSLAVFQEAALILLTDARIPITPGRDTTCDTSRGFLECGDGSCFRHDELCDGITHCRDGFDEAGCAYFYQDFPPNHEKEDPLALSSDALFRLFRTQFILDIFDDDDVEWCNTELWIGHRGQEEVQRTLVKTVEDWYLEAYALHPEYGLAFTKQPLFFQTDPPFYILAEGPSVCRRGEQVSIRVMMYNMLPTTQQALLLLHESEDYQFVNVEFGGDVQHFHPRLTSGEHQHLVFVPPEGLKEVTFPLAITKQSGTVEVTIEAITQIRRDTETWEIEVMPEGVPVRKHTSLVLDLRNRALVYEFLDVPIDESPIIPFSILRRFVSGSPAARVSVAGDVFGPTPDGIAVDHTEVFEGRHFRSTDGVVYNFGATLWTLHYLRLTNQLDLSESRDAFDYLTVQLAGLLWRYEKGAFSMWAFSPPSVWLTAKVVNILVAAQHEDWENFLYIDPQIIQQSVAFLMEHQQLDGGFGEELQGALDSKMGKTKFVSTVPLTALVTVALHNSLSVLQGNTHSRAVDARARATRYLDIQLPQLTDCYHLAITAYALTLLGSPSADLAANMLTIMMRQEGDMAYWSLQPITTHRRRQENNQRAFLLPRDPEKWDAHAVETTSYGLLVFLMRKGVTTNTESIMRWLNAIRDWDFAFVSTADSLVAMQALAEYAYRARLRDVTNMQCTLDITAQPQIPIHVAITNSSLSTLHSYELENVWGHVNLVAKGSGQGVAQLEVSWGVDVLSFIEQPHKKYFDLSVIENYHQFRNKSLITTTICASWLALEDGNASSSAMVEVEIPTGYYFFQPLAESRLMEVQKAGIFPQIRNVHTTETHVFWQFENIPAGNKQCFTYELQRWFPAANLTAIRSATIMELFAPEHFEMVMINSTPLALLDVCEVCGSYQCPYCPAYSSAWSLHIQATSGYFIVYLSLWLTLLIMHVQSLK
ncbi:hypothetical protein Pcinc_033930 [Petrolisthes cinctipes]|uniref:CD109 antigen n=1 Tax=Petrolisthes cinctipes TaxID=88211 RepID=A0AAE1ER97_PETCI|nr:hypothetical protein Pcinc_033930 [Petrolisthes cinctipes]